MSTTIARQAVRDLAADNGTDELRRKRLFDAANRRCVAAGVTERQVAGWLATAKGTFPARQAWMLVAK